MDLELKKAIAKEVADHDPDHEVVIAITANTEWTVGEVKYNWDNLGKARQCGKWCDDIAGGAEELARCDDLNRQD